MSRQKRRHAHGAIRAIRVGYSIDRRVVAVGRGATQPARERGGFAVTPNGVYPPELPTQADRNRTDEGVRPERRPDDP